MTLSEPIRALGRNAFAVFIAALCLVVLLSAVVPESLPGSQNTDYRVFYAPVAKNLAGGNGLTLGDGELAIYWPPGYPTLLAASLLVGDLLGAPPSRSAELMVWLLAALTATILFLIARHLFDAGTAWLAAGLWLLYPLILVLWVEPHVEIPFMFFTYSAILLTLGGAMPSTRWRWLAAGIALGIAALIRPVGLLLILPFGIAAWVINNDSPARTRWHPIVLLCVGAAMVVLPWEVCLYQSTGRVIPISANGLGATLDGITVGTDDDEEIDRGFPPDVRSLMRSISTHREDFDAVGDVYAYMANRFLESPVTVSKLYAIKAGRAWFATESGEGQTLIAMIQVPTLVLGVIGIIVGLSKPKLRPPALLVASLLVYFWFAATFVLSTARQTVPVWGPVFVFIAFLLRTRFARPSRQKLSARPSG